MLAICVFQVLDIRQELIRQELRVEFRLSCVCRADLAHK